jgi:hypothetical protein
MNLRKKDNATMSGISFCIKTILGTYQSNQVTTEILSIAVNHPSSLFVDFSPAKIMSTPFV